MSQEDASKTSSNVREFIYLDTPKLQSYLSQIEGGYSLLVSTLQREYSKVDVEPAVREVLNTSLIRAVAGGSVPFLGKAEGEAKHERTVTTNSGGTSTQTESDTLKSDLTVLHHKIFDVVMEELGDKLVTVQGRIFLIAIDTLRELMDQLGLQAMGDDLPKAQQGFAAISSLGVSNIVYCEGHGQVTSAFLVNDYFTMDQAVFPYVYGIPTEHPFTLVGIAGKKKEAIANVAPRGVGISQAGALTGALGKFGRVIDNMFGNTQRLYPIALYRDL